MLILLIDYRQIIWSSLILDLYCISNAEPYEKTMWEIYMLYICNILHVLYFNYYLIIYVVLYNFFFHPLRWCDGFPAMKKI